jgi:hypothetical protein
MNDLQKELHKLKAKVAELESRHVAKPVKWQPKSGPYYVECLSSTNVFDRKTKEQAERASVAMRKFNRLLALRDELCGDEILRWIDNDEEKYYVYFSHESRAWYVSSDEFCESIQPYFTSEIVAQKACDMLNSGEVEL